MNEQDKANQHNRLDGNVNDGNNNRLDGNNVDGNPNDRMNNGLDGNNGNNFGNPEGNRGANLKDAENERQHEKSVDDSYNAYKVVDDGKGNQVETYNRNRNGKVERVNLPDGHAVQAGPIQRQFVGQNKWEVAKTKAAMKAQDDRDAKAKSDKDAKAKKEHDEKAKREHEAKVKAEQKKV